MTSEVKVWIVAGTSLALAGFCAVSSKLLKKSVGKKTLLSIEPDSFGGCFGHLVVDGGCLKLVPSRHFRAKFDSTLSVSILSCTLILVWMVLAGLSSGIGKCG